MFGAYLSYAMAMQGVFFPQAVIISMSVSSLLGVMVGKVAFRLSTRSLRGDDGKDECDDLKGSHDQECLTKGIA